MNAKHSVGLAIVILLVVVAPVAGADSFLSASPKVTYNEPASAVHASLGKTASDRPIALRLNGVSNASTPPPVARGSSLTMNHKPQAAYITSR